MTRLSSGSIRRRGSSLRTAAAAGSVCLLVSGIASADPPKTGDPAAAQALFYEARTLMHESKYGLACPKLEESLRLDYGMGTEFNLADCNEKLGKLASAWAGFINVSSAAKAQNQPQREKLARDRAAALEPRLPNLIVNVNDPSPDLEVKRDGLLVGSASWRAPMPIDPGVHRMTASAPGKQTWEATVTAVEGQPLRVDVPVLAPLLATATVAPLPVPGGVGQPPAPQPIAFPEPIVEHSNAQCTVGWIATTLGVAGLGVGAAFGIDSVVQHDQSRVHCTGNLCDAQGVDYRNRAITSGDISTITTIAGGAVLLGGIVLVLTAPRRTERREPPPLARIFAAPSVAANSGGLSIGGDFQ